MSIFIYTGVGASPESIAHTEHMFEHFAERKLNRLSTVDLLAGTWTQNASLLVMPGGADLPYVSKLNGRGNAIIREFVQNGGSYLGICAGAYYGSSSIEFDKGGRFEVIGDRELSFIPGTAIGPILAPYDYKTNSGVRAALIRSALISQPTHVYFNGGSYFKIPDDEPGVEILAEYQNIDPTKAKAIVKTKFGKGTVILSGVHFEFTPEMLNPEDPHLKEVIPALRNDKNGRHELIRKILSELHFSSP